MNPVLFKFLPEEQPCIDDQDACLIADTVTLFSGLTVKFTQKECGYNDSCYSAAEIPTDTFPFTTVKVRSLYLKVFLFIICQKFVLP